MQPVIRYILVLSVVLLTGCSQKWLAEAIITVPNTNRTGDPPADNAASMLARGHIDGAMRVQGASPEVSLAVWIVDPPTDDEHAVHTPRGTVLVAHGLRDNKRKLLRLGHFLAHRGYRAVLVDLRGHGASSGQWGTFGVMEGRDLSRVIDRLESDGYLAGRVGAIGHSWGGAAVLQLAACDPRVHAVVTVATFTSMRDIVPPYVKRRAPFSDLITDAQIVGAINGAGRIAGFDPDDADSRVAAETATARILFVHGALDGLISADHARRLHERAAANSELLIIDNANHHTVMAGARGREVAKAAVEWFDTWLPTTVDQDLNEASRSVSSNATIRRTASPRWDNAFFFSGGSSALVQPSSGNSNSGS
jgi:pimeloyl-ACP methyl ester carboxylesterase